MLATLLGSKLRARALSHLLSRPHREFFVRQLADAIDEDPTSLGRELARLTQMRILAYRPSGLLKLYRANRQCPVFRELAGLTAKLAGAALADQPPGPAGGPAFPKGADMSRRFRRAYNRARVEQWCRQLIAQRRGKMLGEEVLAQLDSGRLTDPTFQRLCRWVHPRRREPQAQPLAEQICRKLFGRTYPRED